MRHAILRSLLRRAPALAVFVAACAWPGWAAGQKAPGAEPKPGAANPGAAEPGAADPGAPRAGAVAPIDEEREAAMLQALLGEMGGPIGPSAEALAPIKDKLAKEIRVQFLGTPLERVVEFLQRESGVTMLIDRKATGGQERAAVSLEADKMTIKDALNWACMTTETDWDVIKNVIVISTTRAIELRQRTTKVYDVRGLIYSVPSFTGAPEFDLNSALSNTSSGGSSGGAQSATTLFSDEDTTGEQPTRAESVEQLVTLIQDTIGNQPDWAAYGGEVSSLREITGNLVIKTTPRNHEAIGRLLADMAASTERMVQIDARYILVNSKALDDLIKKNDGQFIIAPDKVDAFLAAISAPAAGKRLGGSKLVMFNGQRTFLSAANATSFLSDVEPVAHATGVDPTQSVLVSGTKTDIEATVAQNGRSIVMTLRSGIITARTMRQTGLPIGGKGSRASAAIEETGTITGTVAPDGPPRKDGTPAPGVINGATKGTGKLILPDGANDAPPGTVQLDLPEQDGVTYVTSLSIPNGGAVVLTGASSMIKTAGAEDVEIVMIVRASSKAPVKAPAEGTAPAAATPAN